jgi:hypothetical protein
MKEIEELKTKISVDTEELEDATDLIEEVGERLHSVVPNIVIRNNQTVYVTINNFNEPEKQRAEPKDSTAEVRRQLKEQEQRKEMERKK